MLIANAANTTLKLWTQTLNLKPLTNYLLTFNAASLAGPPSSLLFGLYINCYRVGDDITGNYTGNCSWQKYSIQIKTPANANPADLTTLIPYDVSIVNITATASGNDVAIDDIEFFECTGATGTIAPFPTVAQYIWRGYNNDWFNIDNWGAWTSPTCGDNLIIPGNLLKYPIINS